MLMRRVANVILVLLVVAVLFGMQVGLRALGCSHFVSELLGFVAAVIVTAFILALGLFDNSWGESAAPGASKEH